jgi:hypothetical protein
VPKTFFKAITLADSALKIVSQCSFTARVNSAYSTIFALPQLRSLRFEKGFNFKTIFVAVFMLPSQLALAETMSDPMRPPQSGSAPQRATGDPRWTVTGILISSERKLAMINDRLIGVGESVDGARVRNIYGNGVELDIGGRSIVLRPVAGSLRRDEKPKENQ